jgi:transposase-like protein
MVANGIFCPQCKQTFNDRFDTLYYHRHVTPEQIRQVLQAHSEGSSLRGLAGRVDLPTTQSSALFVLPVSKRS